MIGFPGEVPALQDVLFILQWIKIQTNKLSKMLEGRYLLKKNWKTIETFHLCASGDDENLKGDQ